MSNTRMNWKTLYRYNLSSVCRSSQEMYVDWPSRILSRCESTYIWYWPWDENMWRQR